MVVATLPPLVSESVGITSRKYQRDGEQFLWDIQRAMITDAPGLGKTPQAALAAECPCIIVCPTYLTQQWGDWLRTHLPKRKVVVAKGNKATKTEMLVEPCDFLVVNKEMLRTHAAEIIVVATRYHYKTLIIDESHHFRNRGTSAAKGIVALAKVCKRVYELTATPIWKEVDDLFMQLRILYPDVFTSYWDFINTWCNTSTDHWGTKVTGVKADMLGALEELMDTVRIGRTYEEAGRELPPIIENLISLDFEPSERKRYDDLVNTYRLQLEEHEDLWMSSYMEVMHTLRNLTGLEKVDAIKETLEDSATMHHGKYVVFTWYRDLAERLAQALPGAVLITGDMTPEDRQRAAQRQQPIVATISALSEGVDLSWARAVVFAEEHWTPGSQVQTLARVRRERNITPIDFDGPLSEWDEILMALDSRAANDEPILVYYAIVANSIDETIHRKTRERSATIKQVLHEALGIYL